MRRFLVGMLAFFGFTTLLVLVALVVAGIYLARTIDRPPEVPERAILTVDLRAGVEETAPDNPLERLRGAGRLTMADLLVALEAAGRDPRVQGVVFRVGGGGPNLAQVEELIDAIDRLRARGIFTIAQAETFGELGPGNVGYYLASATDEIHLQPVGFVGLTGLNLSGVFFRGLLDELGVTPEFTRREAYKTAMDMILEHDMTPENRDMLESLADSLFEPFVARIAEGRGKGVAEMRRLIDGGPYFGPEALELGLIDAIGHRDEVLAHARERGGEGSEVFGIASYHRNVSADRDAARSIAIVHGVGLISPGGGDGLPGLGRFALDADRLARALHDAIEDDETRVILFRVDSGGGSAVASETIAYQLRRAREAGKPVIVSMGQSAASGGYWIAIDAATIVAAPATLTASIGVVAGKPVVNDLAERFGVRAESVARGANAGMWAITESYTPRGRARLEAMADGIYEAFVDRVAKARGLEREHVLEVAKGRVWTGAQAKELGLVDDTGGFLRALALAREAAGLEPEAPVILQPYPRPRDPVRALLELFRLPTVVADAIVWLAPLIGPGTAQAPLVRIE